MANELFFDNQYVLRIHQRGYQTPEEIISELEWLSALRRDAVTFIVEHGKAFQKLAHVFQRIDDSQ